MRKSILYILISLSSLICFSQNDSIYCAWKIKYGSYARYKIIIPQESEYIFEEHSLLKQVYQLDLKKIVSTDFLNRTCVGYVEKNNSKSWTYYKFHICDIEINKIRNNSYMSQDIGLVLTNSREKIGKYLYDNIIFQPYKLLSDSIQNLCFDDFKIEEARIIKRGEFITDSIYKAKNDRYIIFLNDSSSINQNTVEAFLKSFDRCLIDCESFKCIAMLKPELLMENINKLTDIEFNDLLNNLDCFRSKEEVLKVKENIKNTKIKSGRKGKLLKMIEATKG